jgi:hypothetical protein
MPKRKNASTTPPPQAPTIDDKLKQGFGSLALEGIAKKPRQDLEADTFKQLMEHGKTTLEKYELTDQIKKLEDKRLAVIDARVKAKGKRFESAKSAVKTAFDNLIQKGIKNPTLKRQLIPELTRQFPEQYKDISESTLKDWLSDLNKGKKILDGT